MKKSNFEKIVCPYCGREYLPAEIFLPNSFLGKPKDIEKTSVGKIGSYIGDTMDTIEHYVCDGCDNPFKVTARVQFMTEIKDKYNFSEDYTQTIQQTKLVLKED